MAGKKIKGIKSVRKSWVDVYGYFNHGECFAMQKICRGLDVLEVGSFYGKSTLCIAEEASRVYTVDTFKAHDNGVIQMDSFTTLDTFRKNKEGYDNIFPIAGKSDEVIPSLRLLVDVVFVDGLHEYGQVKKDIEVCWPKLKYGGIMAFHDFISYHNDVGRAVKELNLEIIQPVSNLAFVFKTRRFL